MAGDKPLTAEREAEIRARLTAATAGPWLHYRNKLRPNFGIIINEVQTARRGQAPIVKWAGFDESRRRESSHAANAEFIAYARTDVPALLAEIDRLRSELAGARRTTEEVAFASNERMKAMNRLQGELASAREAALREAAAWHHERARDTPDAFETELHQVSRDAILALINPPAAGAEGGRDGG